MQGFDFQPDDRCLLQHANQCKSRNKFVEMTLDARLKLLISSLKQCSVLRGKKDDLWCFNPSLTGGKRKDL